MIKRMAIYDTEVAYANRLMDYMKKVLNDFELLLFTRWESLEGFLKDHEVELLLLGEGVREEQPLENIRYTLRLSGTKVSGYKEYPQTVYKYQSAKEVINELLACYMKAQGLKGPGRELEMKMISVYAPKGGYGEASYAWLLAHYLADKQKVLYLSLEQLPVLMDPILAGEDQALSEFIYYLKEKHDQLILKLNGLLKYSGKLACLSGLAHGLDLLSLGKEDAVRLIEELKTNTDYEAIIIYHGIYTEFSIELMSRSQECHVLYHGNSYSKAALREWDRQMEFLKLDTGTERYQRVLLPEDSYREGTGSDNREGLKDSALSQLVKQQAGLL